MVFAEGRVGNEQDHDDATGSPGYTVREVGAWGEGAAAVEARRRREEERAAETWERRESGWDDWSEPLQLEGSSPDELRRRREGQGPEMLLRS